MLLETIREESNELGPIKLQYTLVLEIEKETEQGEENETCYLEQRDPMLLNAYNRVELKKKTQGQNQRTQRATRRLDRKRLGLDI